MANIPELQQCLEAFQFAKALELVRKDPVAARKTFVTRQVMEKCYPIFLIAKSDVRFGSNPYLRIELFEAFYKICPESLYEYTDKVGNILRWSMWHNKAHRAPYPLGLIIRILDIWPECSDVSALKKDNEKYPTMWELWEDDCPNFIRYNPETHCAIKVLFDKAKIKAKENRINRLNPICQSRMINILNVPIELSQLICQFTA